MVPGQSDVISTVIGGLGQAGSESWSSHKGSSSQRLQYPLMKEYTLKLSRVPIMMLRYIP